MSTNSSINNNSTSNPPRLLNKNNNYDNINYVFNDNNIIRDYMETVTSEIRVSSELNTFWKSVTELILFSHISFVERFASDLSETQQKYLSDINKSLNYI